MKWTPLEKRKIPKPLEIVLVAPLLVIFVIPLLAMFYVDEFFRKRFGAKSEWKVWFAWYPVRSDRGFGDTVWLEKVERRRWYDHVEHRTLAEAALDNSASKPQ